jgi:hypothetical protein
MRFLLCDTCLDGGARTNGGEAGYCAWFWRVVLDARQRSWTEERGFLRTSNAEKSLEPKGWVTGPVADYRTFASSFLFVLVSTYSKWGPW